MRERLPCARCAYTPKWLKTQVVYPPLTLPQEIYTVPSRRDNFFLLSCPVPSRHKKVVVLYRPVPSTKSHLPSRPVHYVTVPSRPVCIFFPTKHVKTVPSRPVSNITSHEKPREIGPTLPRGLKELEIRLRYKHVKRCIALILFLCRFPSWAYA